jgi:hypothetical protein
MERLTFSGNKFIYKKAQGNLSFFLLEATAVNKFARLSHVAKIAPTLKVCKSTFDKLATENFEI